MDTITLCLAIKDVTDNHQRMLQVLVDDVAKNAVKNAALYDAARDAQQAINALLDGEGNLPPCDRLRAAVSRLADALRVSEFNR